MIAWNEIWPGGAGQYAHGRLHAPWSVLLDMFGNQLSNHGWFLISHQATSNLGMRLSGQDSLDPFPLEATPNAIDLQRGSRSKMFPGRIARLRQESSHAYPLL